VLAAGTFKADVALTCHVLDCGNYSRDAARPYLDLVPSGRHTSADKDLSLTEGLPPEYGEYCSGNPYGVLSYN